MDIEKFTKKAIELLNSTNEEIHAVIVYTDGEKIGHVKHGTNDNLTKSLAKYLDGESLEFNQALEALIEVLKLIKS